MIEVNQYTPHAIDPNILSTLNVDQAGEVVSAEVWKSLWDLVLGLLIKYNEYFADIYRTLAELSKELDACVKRIERIEKLYDDLVKRMESLEKTWTDLRDTYIKIANNYEEIVYIYNSLKAGFIHYGDSPPEDANIKLWVQPTNDVLDPFRDMIAAFLADSSARLTAIEERLGVLEEDYAKAYKLIGGAG